jgi:hypothetical protein
MKKTILTMAATVGVSLLGYSQGAVNLQNYQGLNGQLVAIANSAGAVTGYAGDFTVALYYASTVSSTPLANADSYGYLSYAGFQADNLSLATTVTSTGANGAGVFEGGTATLGIAGGYTAGQYTVSDVLALAAWTGGYSTLAEAEAAGADVGIITFVNNIGPGGSSPEVPYLTGWDSLTPTPGVESFEGSSQYPDLVMSPAVVPEPGTMAMAGLGSLSLLLFRRKK